MVNLNPPIRDKYIIVLNGTQHYSSYTTNYNIVVVHNIFNFAVYFMLEGACSGFYG